MKSQCSPRYRAAESNPVPTPPQPRPTHRTPNASQPEPIRAKSSANPANLSYVHRRRLACNRDRLV